MPKVSIVIPAYNAENYIQETLESIAGQTYSDFECIIVNDGSKDKTLDLVLAAQKQDNRLKIISIENSGGPAKPRNVAVEMAQGEYIFMFDSDDLMGKNKIQRYLDVFESNPAIDVLFSDFSLINENGSELQSSFLDGYHLFRHICEKVSDNVYSLDMKIFHEEIIRGNFIGTSSVAFKNRGASNWFNTAYQSGDDLLAWAKMGKNMAFYFIDEVHHQYRKRDGSISNNNTERLLRNKISILNEIKKLDLGEGCDEEIRIKSNEYWFSLGYFYRKAGRRRDAFDSYLNVKGYVAFFSVIKEILKLFIFNFKRALG